MEGINCRNAKARLWYDRGANEGEFEDADLTEAIRAGHVSVYHPDFQYRNGPPTKPSRKRHHGDSEDEDLTVKQPRQRKPTAKMAALKGELVPETDGHKKKAARTETGATGDDPAHDDDGEEEEEEEDAEQAALDDAEREYQRLLAKRRRESRAAAAAAAAQRPAGARKSAGDEDEKRDREQRDKVVVMLTEALRLARGEVQAEHGSGADEAGAQHPHESPTIPDEAACHDLGVAIEEGVFQAHGQGLTKEYKARIRSLQFNLKDPANPGLRARVLLGEVPPARLATMAAEELASKQLVAWRQQKAQEAVKAVTMELEPDVDKLGRRLRKTHKGEEMVEVGAAAAGGDPGDVGGGMAGSSVVVIPPLLPPLSDAEGALGGAGLGGDDGDGDRGTFSPKLGGGRHGGGGGGSDPLPSFEAFAAASGHEAAGAPSDEGGREAGVKVHMAAGPMKMVALPSSAPPPQAPKPAAAPTPRVPSGRHAKAAVPRSPAEHGAPPAARASTSGPPEWSGLVVSNTPNVSVRVTASPIGGEQAPLGGGLLPSHIQVKGRTHMSEVEKYVLHHIQRGKSTSKALTLAVCTASCGDGQDTAEAAAAAVNALCDGYAQRDRAGLAQTSGGVEIYLLAPQSELTSRLLACEGLVPLPTGAGQLLLALVHRKGLGAAHPKLLAPAEGGEHGGVLASPAQGLDHGGDEDDLPDMDASAAVAAVQSVHPPQAAVPDIQASFKSLADMLLPGVGGGAGGPPAAAPVISSTLLQMLTQQPQGMAPPPPGGRLQEDLPEWSFRGPMPPQQQQHGTLPGLPMMGGPYGMAPPPPGVVPFAGAHIPPPRPPPGMPPPRPGMPPQQQPQQQPQWMAPGGPVNGGMPPMQQLPPGFVLGPGGAPVQVMPGLPPPRPPPGPPPGMMPPGQGQRFDPRRARQ